MTEGIHQDALDVLNRVWGRRGRHSAMQFDDILQEAGAE